MRVLLGRVFLVVSFFLFITLNISCHFLWLEFSVEKSVDNLMRVSLYVVVFPLLLLILLFVSLIFVSLITVCLHVFLLEVFLPGTLCFLYLVEYVLPHVREVFSYYLFKHFLRSSLSSSSGTPIMQMLVHLMLFQRSLGLSSFLFNLFSIFCSAAVISTFLSSRSFIHSSASVILLLIPSSVLFISVCF